MRRAMFALLTVLAFAWPVSAQEGMFGGVMLAQKCRVTAGSGSPEGAVVGSICDEYLRSDGGTIYLKTSGTGNTGWILTIRTAVGTSNQVSVSAAGGDVTFSLPQSIHTGATPTFAGLTLTSTSAPQLSVRYDASNRLDVSVSSAGIVTLDAVGASHAFTLPDPLSVTGNITASGDLAANGGDLTSSAGLNITPAAGQLRLNPSGDIETDPTGNDVLPVTNYDINIGALSLKYLTLHAAELWVETLVAQNTIATIGGRILVGPTNITVVDVGTGGVTWDWKYNNFAIGDTIYMEANGKVEFMAVTAGPTGSGPYSYTVTRNLDGTGANDWFAGDAAFNTGAAGNGFIDLYSLRGVKAGTEVGPTIVGNVRINTTFNNWAARWAIGNLNGLYGYGATTYGVAMGDAAATNLTMDATNGFRIRHGATNKLVADISGNLSLVGDLTVDGSGSLGAGNVTINTNGVSIVSSTGTTFNTQRAYAFTGTNTTYAGTGYYVDSGFGATYLISYGSNADHQVRIHAHNTGGGTADAFIFANAGNVGISEVILRATSIDLQDVTANSMLELTTAGAMFDAANGGFSLAYNGSALGEMNAGYRLYTPTADSIHIIADSSSGTAGKTVQIGYYSGAGWYSAVEIANISGVGHLLLMKAAGTVTIGATTNGEVLRVASLRADTNSGGTPVNLRVDGNGDFWYASSSQTTKKNVAPLDRDFLRILEAQPVSYHGVGQRDTDKAEVGFLAEQLVTIGLEDFVAFWPDEEGTPQPVSIDYGRMVVYIVPLMAQQQQRLASLEADVAALKKGTP